MMINDNIVCGNFIYYYENNILVVLFCFVESIMKLFFIVFLYIVNLSVYIIRKIIVLLIVLF